jgi:hypothetical protein
MVNTNQLTVEDLNAISELSTKIRHSNREHLRDLIKQFLVGIKKHYPDAKGFTWVQYTPGFNDGDPCEFGMSENSTYYDTLEVDFREAGRIYPYPKEINGIQEVLSSLGDYEIIFNFEDDSLTLNEYDCGY